jgi:hypothetical protein
MIQMGIASGNYFFVILLQINQLRMKCKGTMKRETFSNKY